MRRARRFLPLLAAAALSAAAAADPDPDRAPDDGEIEQFRGALEAHFNGNLPQLLQYVRAIDGGSEANADPPAEGATSSWSPSPRWGRDSHGNWYVVETAEQVRRRLRARVEDELRRIASE